MGGGPFKNSPTPPSITCSARADQSGVAAPN